jgi:hypothetical protein
MGTRQIRIGQLIAPFGPGSIYTDRRGTPHVVCGLDHWFMRWNPTTGLTRCDDRTEFERTETRLAALLHIDRFCIPPDVLFLFVLMAIFASFLGNNGLGVSALMTVILF